MSDPLSLPKTLVTIGKASERPNFELQFNQLQNTVIRRINDGIRKSFKINVDKKKLSENSIQNNQL